MAENPFKLVDHEDSFSLIFDDFNLSPAVTEAFEEAGYESSGYAWHGVSAALVQMRAPHLEALVKYDPESSMFAAYGPSREALAELAQLLFEATTDVGLLGEALAQADPELMD